MTTQGVGVVGVGEEEEEAAADPISSPIEPAAPATAAPSSPPAAAAAGAADLEEEEGTERRRPSRPPSLTGPPPSTTMEEAREGEAPSPSSHPASSPSAAATLTDADADVLEPRDVTPLRPLPSTILSPLPSSPASSSSLLPSLPPPASASASAAAVAAELQALQAQRDELNAKLVRSLERCADLEDAVFHATESRQEQTGRIKALEREREEHLHALKCVLLSLSLFSSPPPFFSFFGSVLKEVPLSLALFLSLGEVEDRDGRGRGRGTGRAGEEGGKRGAEGRSGRGAVEESCALGQPLLRRCVDVSKPRREGSGGEGKGRASGRRFRKGGLSKGSCALSSEASNEGSP